MSYPGAVIPPPTGATWDGSRKGSAVTLSGSNLIATVSGGEGNVPCTLSRNAATAAHYWEMTEVSAVLYCATGLIKDTDASPDVPLGTGTAQVAVYNNSGYFFYVGAGTGYQASGNPSGMSFGVGAVVFGYLESGSLWFGVVGSGWYDTASGTFKATKALAAPFMTGLTGNWAPGTGNGFGGAACSATGNFAGPFAGAIPSGGAAWSP
jgi:hypothetical protein